jgi:hypothetical protein
MATGQTSEHCTCIQQGMDGRALPHWPLDCRCQRRISPAQAQQQQTRVHKKQDVGHGKTS